MSNNAVYLALREKLVEALNKNALDIYGAQGAVNFNFSASADNLARIFQKFWDTHKRMPEVMFNDGVPKRFDSLRSQPDFTKVMSYYTQRIVYGHNSETGFDIESVVGSPHFNVKVRVAPTTVQVEEIANAEQGSTYTRNVTIEGAFNNKPDGVPWSQVEYGAFQTWGVMLVAYSNPEFLYATDEGLMLTRDGCMMVDRSLAYWLEPFLVPVGLDMYGGIAKQKDFYAPGPVMIGAPLAILDKLKQAAEASKKAGGTTGFFKYILQMVFTFVGFYFGASAFSGTVAGNFSIANIGKSLSFVNSLGSSVGIDMGNLGTISKVIGLTSGQLSTDTLKDAAPAAEVLKMDDWGGYDLWADIGIDPNSISNWEPMSSEDFSSFWTDMGMGDWEAAMDAFNQAPAYDDIAIQIENDAALAEAMGPMSPTQYALAAKTEPQVAAATQAAIKAAGGKPDSVKTTPQTAQRAATNANANAAQARLTGDSAGATIWDTAGKLLTMYTQYQLADAKITAAQGGALPNKLTYPAAVGNVSRQPDGSISVRNADGTITTIRPNGQSLTTPNGGALPSFLSANKIPIMIGAGVLAVVGVIAATSRRR